MIRTRVLLGLQTALLGMITPNIRGITCSWGEKKIIIRFIYDGKYSEDDVELCEEIASEVASHFNEHKVQTQIYSLDYPNSLKSEFLTAWAYLRREDC